MLHDLQSDIASRLRVVFRHYPLSGIHHHAQQAAEAAEAAGAQGKFWEMHTLLFKRQAALHTKDLIRYAGELNLDVQRFRNELKNQAYRDTAAYASATLAWLRSNSGGSSVARGMASQNPRLRTSE